MNQQPDEEIGRVSSQTKEILCSCSLGLGMVAHESILVPQHGSSPNPLLLGFYGGFIKWRHDLLTHWLLVIDSTSSFSVLPRN